MPSSQERSASIMTSWLIEVPQSPEGSFSARHYRKIRVPEVLGDTVGTFQFRRAPKSMLESSCAARIM
jgi:hypothetical protein